MTKVGTRADSMRVAGSTGIGASGVASEQAASAAKPRKKKRLQLRPDCVWPVRSMYVLIAQGGGRDRGDPPGAMGQSYEVGRVGVPGDRGAVNPEIPMASRTTRAGFELRAEERLSMDPKLSLG